jgi:hypothetical protein
MKGGDWIVCKHKVNSKQEKVRGYIKRFYDEGKVIVRPVNYGSITSIYVNLDDIEKDDSRDSDDVQELIDWALADGDRTYFQEIATRDASTQILKQ